MEDSTDEISRECIWCGSYAARLFCSDKCRRKYEREDMEGAIPVGVCGICEDEYYRHNGNQKYCSWDCGRVALFLRRPRLGAKFLVSHPEYIETYAMFGITADAGLTRGSKKIKYDIKPESSWDKSLEKYNDLKFRILHDAESNTKNPILYRT